MDLTECSNKLEHLVTVFSEEQTIEGLNDLLVSLDLKRMEGGKWVNEVKDIVLPIRFVRLYSKIGKVMVLTGLGIF